MIDTTVPKLTRNVWPKAMPPLDDEQRRISDDFVHHWHEVLPERYGLVEKFNHTYPTRVLPDKAHFRTLEVGAGIGGHIPFEDLSRQDYHCLELREIMASEIMKRYPQVSATIGDCQARIPFDDGHFDRVIFVHVLEHLPDLPSALDEVRRVLAPGGLLSIVIPCDPGLAYELGRKISAERIFRKRYKLPYEWFIRREHINSPAEILGQLAKRFESVHRAYFPFGAPIIDINLCIGATWRRPAA